MQPTPAELDTIRTTVSESPLFADLPESARDTLAGHAELLTVRGGEVLFHTGDAPEAFYLVATGRLRAVLPNGQVAGDIGRLEPAGEMGVISGESRTASVIALRDSLVCRFRREAFHAFVLAHPAALLTISRVLISRLRQNAREAQLHTLRQARTFALFDGLAGAAGPSLAHALAAALGRFGKALCIDAAAVDAALGAGTADTPCAPGTADTALLEWLSRLEASHDYLVYDSSGPKAWQQRALHQADRVLVQGRADLAPEPATADGFSAHGVRAPVDLLLARSGRADACMAWRRRYQADAHYFLRPQQPGDLASVARQLTGHGLGLVLGGGGARGFAHIGMLRALDELRLPIDLIGGTSMGAFISALHAAGHDWRTVREILRETFVTYNALNDYLLPRVALIEGKKLRRRLDAIFGSTLVEALATPYYCVSTNLSTGEPVVHRDGPLAAWVATSMCIPGVAPPVVYRGHLLADGAVVNSLPTDVMQGLARGPIIASDVSTEDSLAMPGVEGPDFDAVRHANADGRRISLIDILFRVSTLTSESGVKARAAKADLYVRMPVGDVPTFAWKRLDEIAELGYQHALRLLGPQRARFSAD